MGRWLIGLSALNSCSRLTLQADGFKPLGYRLHAEMSINKAAPSIDEVKEAVAKLRDGQATGICNIDAQLLIAGGEAMIRGLHAVLTVAWHSGTIPPDWKRGLGVLIWKGKGDRQDCNNYPGITLLSVLGKVLSHLLLMRVRNHLLKYQRPK